MKQLQRAAACCLLAVTGGCAQYLIVAAEPRYAGQPHRKAQASIAGGTAASPPQAVALDCGPGEQLAMVRVTRNLGQGMLGLVTLGMYAPATIHYFCATEPAVEGNGIDTGAGG